LRRFHPCENGPFNLEEESSSTYFNASASAWKVFGCEATRITPNLLFLCPSSPAIVAINGTFLKWKSFLIYLFHVVLVIPDSQR
jgi:hypothetical protein